MKRFFAYIQENKKTVIKGLLVVGGAVSLVLIVGRLTKENKFEESEDDYLKALALARKYDEENFDKELQELLELERIEADERVSQNPL